MPPLRPPRYALQAFGRLVDPEQLHLVEAALKLPPLVEQLHERLGALRSFNPSNPTGDPRLSPSFPGGRLLLLLLQSAAAPTSDPPSAEG
jgi:hypothetical protein